MKFYQLPAATVLHNDLFVWHRSTAPPGALGPFLLEKGISVAGWPCEEGICCWMGGHIYMKDVVYGVPDAQLVMFNITFMMH